MASAGGQLCVCPWSCHLDLAKPLLPVAGWIPSIWNQLWLLVVGSHPNLVGCNPWDTDFHTQLGHHAEVSEEGQGLNLKPGRVVAPEDDGRLGVLVQPGVVQRGVEF